MPTVLKVKEPTPLLQFLFAQMPERSRSAVKSLLAHRLVTVDERPVTQFDHPLTPGQTVSILRPGESAPSGSSGVKIVFEDPHLLVVEKRAGLLSIATESEREKTAYSLTSEHVKKADSRNRIFVVHRLDRETSGLMLFAKSQAVQKALQEAWNETIRERTYLAVVEGVPAPPEGTVVSWLKEDKFLVMRSSPRPNDGQKATTHYRVLQSNGRYSLLEVNLETGRKNQIRVHMQDLHHSIVGDRKYGATQDPLHRLGLHARVLAFKHPVTAQELRFETPIPESFANLVK